MDPRDKYRSVNYNLLHNIICIVSNYNYAWYMTNDQTCNVIYSCDDICVESRPDHLAYNSEDIGSSSTSSSSLKGLLVTMNNQPCINQTNGKCCENNNCATFAAGHLSSNNNYLYGHFEWYSVRTGHSYNDNNSPNGPSNEFTCLSCYTNTPIHNEIAMCVSHDSTQIHCGYWYNNTANVQKTANINSSQNVAQTYNNFHFHWNSKEILYMLGDETLWHVTSDDPKLLPYHACQVRIILRPIHNSTYQGPSYLFIESFSYQEES